MLFRLPSFEESVGLGEERGSRTVRIEWGVTYNRNRQRGGFMPVIWVNGKMQGALIGRGYAEDVALSLAMERAAEEATRYVGGWAVTLRERL